MILSNVEILRAIKSGRLEIGDLTGKEDPSKPPFNTTSVDLHLGNSVGVPKAVLATIDFSNPGSIKEFLGANSDWHDLTKENGYKLLPQTFVLASTRERVHLPIIKGKPALSARIEGRSSIARCGILIHFTAPTIHPRFRGPLTLEIINLGRTPLQLFSGFDICQLIIEQVHGKVVPTANQFIDQVKPSGQ